jgi:hypothetical protein
MSLRRTNEFTLRYLRVAERRESGPESCQVARMQCSSTKAFIFIGKEIFMKCAKGRENVL